MTIAVDLALKPQNNQTNTHLDEEDIVGSSTMIVFLLSYGIECSVSFLRVAECVIVALSCCAHISILYLFTYREKYSVCICIQRSEFKLKQQKLLPCDRITHSKQI